MAQLRVISVNFYNSSYSLASSDIAGVVPQACWNNMPYGTGAERVFSGTLVDHTGADAGVGLRVDHRIGQTTLQTRLDFPIWDSRPTSLPGMA